MSPFSSEGYKVAMLGSRIHGNPMSTSQPEQMNTGWVNGMDYVCLMVVLNNSLVLHYHCIIL